MNSLTQNAFRALADAHRREILALLSQRELTIAEITENFGITRAAIKKHLVILEEGGLISITPSGRERISKLEPEGFKLVADWLVYFDGYWDEKLANLKSAIEKES